MSTPSANGTQVVAPTRVQWTDSQAPIGFKLQNSSGEPVVYIDDPTDSVLTLTLINQTKSPLAMCGAPAVPTDMYNAGTATALYLAFQNLVDDDGLKAMSVVPPPGWNCSFIPGEPSLLGFCPASNFSWAVNSPLSITISNVVVTEPSANAALAVYYVNFDQQDVNSEQLQLFVQNKPGTKSDAQLSLRLDDNVVYISADGVSPVANSLTFTLTNGQLDKPVKASADTRFYLSFGYGQAPGRGALMRTDSGLPDVTMLIDGGDGWTIERAEQANPPYIAFIPTGDIAIGIGTDSVAEFQVDNMIVPADFVAGPSPVFLHYVNLPDYRDGFVNVLVQKKHAVPSISLSASPTADYGSHPLLAWSTVACPYLQLSYRKFGKGLVTLPAEGGNALPLQATAFQVPDTIAEDTTFILAGYSKPPSTAGQQPLVQTTVEVTVNYLPPTITSLNVRPEVWPFSIGSTDVVLDWQFQYAEPIDTLTLNLSGFADRNFNRGPNSVAVSQVSGETTWTLTGTGLGGVPVQSSVRIAEEPLCHYLHRMGTFRGQGDSSDHHTPQSSVHASLSLTFSEDGNVTIDLQLALDLSIRSSNGYFQTKTETLEVQKVLPSSVRERNIVNIAQWSGISSDDFNIVLGSPVIVYCYPGYVKVGNLGLVTIGNFANPGSVFPLPDLELRPA